MRHGALPSGLGLEGLWGQRFFPPSIDPKPMDQGASVNWDVCTIDGGHADPFEAGFAQLTHGFLDDGVVLRFVLICLDKDLGVWTFAHLGSPVTLFS